MIRYVKRHLTVWYLTGAALIVSFPIPGGADTLFTADDPRINYYGRFDFGDPLAPRWNWSGATIEAGFYGKSVGIGLVDGKADYDIEIDGVADTVIRTLTSIQRYDIGGSFSDARHEIRIVQRSENHASAATFKGFYLGDGKTLGSAPVKPVRKIEFIGNSDLVAYGTESNTSNCSSSQLRSYTNTNRSYGMLIAKAFNAQAVLLGWSGKGLVRNSDSPTKRSSTSFPAYYNKTLGLLDTKWDFTKWIPDLVAIILGWNDFASSNNDPSKYPDDTMFIGDYHKFIDTILSHYPNAAILCVACHNGPLVDYMKQVVSEETASLKHFKVYYAEYPPDASFKLTGCLGHPAPEDHHLIAQAIIDTVQKKLGWDTAKTDLRSEPYCSRKASSAPRFLKACLIGQQIFIAADALTGSEAEILLRALDGRTIRKIKINRSHQAVIPIAALPAGVYLIGNLKTGWQRFAITR